MPKDRFAALDLLRGLAALAILAFHTGFLPRGYLAVDLFFVLSGFVLAHAYSGPLATAGDLKHFCMARIIRIYPLYLAATLMGAGEYIAHSIWSHGVQPDETPLKMVSSLAIALLLLPVPTALTVSPNDPFPFVYPAWSLFWEIWVNVIYATARVIPGIGQVLRIGIGAGGMLIVNYVYGALAGPQHHGIWSDGARATSFFTGVALFELRRRRRAPAIPAILLGLMLLLTFLPPRCGGALYDLACALILFPALIWVGAEATMSKRMSSIATLLSFISYPVYLLQGPFSLWLAPLWNRAKTITPSASTIELLVDPLSIILASWIAARWIDAPIRTWLRRAHFVSEGKMSNRRLRA